MRYLIIILLVSCSAEKKLNKIYLNQPVLVAEKTRNWFPCIETRADTTIKIIDSLVYIECPIVNNTAQDYFNKDTIIKTISVPVNLPTKYIYIKQQKEDSAKIFTLHDNIEDKNEKLEKVEEKVIRKTNFTWILIVICLVLLFLNIIQYGYSRTSKK